MAECLPGRIFADIRPWRVSGGFGTIEVRQDVFNAVLMTGLIHDLFDETGGDWYGTVGSIFILPEREHKHKRRFLYIPNNTYPL